MIPFVYGWDIIAAVFSSKDVDKEPVACRTFFLSDPHRNLLTRSGLRIYYMYIKKNIQSSKRFSINQFSNVSFVTM